MDCSPIIPAVRAAVHHLHRPVHHVWHHVHHAVTKHVAPVAKAVVAQACSKSTLLPLIVGGGLLAGAVPPAPFGPFGPLGEDGAPLFGPGGRRARSNRRCLAAIREVADPGVGELGLGTASLRFRQWSRRSWGRPVQARRILARQILGRRGLVGRATSRTRMSR